MGAVDMVIIVLAVAAVVGVIAHHIWKKKNGKSGCDCGCSGCPSANSCPSANKNQTDTADNEKKKENEGEMNA